MGAANALDSAEQSQFGSRAVGGFTKQSQFAGSDGWVVGSFAAQSLGHWWPGVVGPEILRNKANLAVSLTGAPSWGPRTRWILQNKANLVQGRRRIYETKPIYPGPVAVFAKRTQFAGFAGWVVGRRGSLTGCSLVRAQRHGRVSGGRGRIRICETKPIWHLRGRRAGRLAKSRAGAPPESAKQSQLVRRRWRPVVEVGCQRARAVVDRILVYEVL